MAIGAQGKQGVQGAQGSQGLHGAPGASGDSGHEGFQGVQGTQGSQGVGTDGPRGYQGPQGYQGDQGVCCDGTQGVQGAAGYYGAQGCFTTIRINGGDWGYQSAGGCNQIYITSGHDQLDNVINNYYECLCGGETIPSRPAGDNPLNNDGCTGWACRYLRTERLTPPPSMWSRGNCGDESPIITPWGTGCCEAYDGLWTPQPFNVSYVVGSAGDTSAAFCIDESTRIANNIAEAQYCTGTNSSSDTGVFTPCFPPLTSCNGQETSQYCLNTNKGIAFSPCWSPDGGWYVYNPECSTTDFARLY